MFVIFVIRYVRVCSKLRVPILVAEECLLILDIGYTCCACTDWRWDYNNERIYVGGDEGDVQFNLYKY